MERIILKDEMIEQISMKLRNEIIKLMEFIDHNTQTTASSKALTILNELKNEVKNKMKKEQSLLGKEIKIETLAKELHEAGREVVMKRKTVVASLGLKTPSKFLEWNEINEDAKEGRRIQARYLLNRFYIVKHQLSL